MKISKQEVEAWLLDPNFEKGLPLLSKIKPYAKNIDLRAMAVKLCFHVGIKIPNPFPPQNSSPAPEKKTVKPVKTETVKEKPESQSQNSESFAPDFIERIVKEHTHLVQLRSQLSEDRLAIPKANTPENNKKRKVLSESIHQHSQRIEALWEANEEFFTKGIKPDMNVLFPGETTNTKEPEFTADEIRKLHHSARSMQKKDENMLKYQTNSVQDTENPMPSGPKRDKILKRMKERALKISEYELILSEPTK